MKSPFDTNCTVLGTDLKPRTLTYKADVQTHAKRCDQSYPTTAAAVEPRKTENPFEEPVTAKTESESD